MRKRSRILATCGAAFLVLATLLMSYPVSTAAVGLPPRVYIPYAVNNSNNSGPSTSPTPSPTPSTSSPNLGTMTYALDAGRQATGRYAADGTALNLSATDANGIVWNLTVPKGALLFPQQITMTPFSTLSSINGAGSQVVPTSGVRLDPDGLQFSSAVTLTVTVPGTLSGVGVILSLNQDGSNVQFAPTTLAGNTASAQIWHFSGAAWSNASDADKLNQLTQAAQAQYNLAYANAQAFVKAGAPTPPTPPSNSLYCMGTAAAYDPTQQDEAYQRSFFKPYRDVVEPLLGAARTLVLLGAGDDSSALNLALQIAGMARTQALSLITQYQNETPPYHFSAVVSTVIAAERTYDLLGGTGDDLSPIAAWAVKVRDYYLGQLRTQHEYQAYPMLIYFERDVILLSGNDDSGTFFQELTGALNFDLSVDNTLSDTAGPTEIAQSGTISSVGLQQDLARWVKSGTINYTSGTAAGQPLVTPLSYSLTVGMANFDPCVNKTADIYLVPPLGTSETFIVKGYPASGFTFAEAIATLAYQPTRYASDGQIAGYKFTVSLTDLNATAADQSFTNSANTGTATSHLVLTHKPQ